MNFPGVTGFKVLVAAAGIPNDPQYGIFALTKASGNALFVSKSNPAALRRLTQ
jgi:hypothetical protein